MTRLQEIEERLSQINTELDGEDVDFEQLELELDGLNEERSAIIEKAEKRSALQERIANLPDVKVIEQFNKEERNQMTDVLGPESMEYRNAFLKDLLGVKLTDVEERAFIHTTENTGEVIPTELENKIYTNMQEQHPILKDINTLRSGTSISIVKHVEIKFGDAKVVAEGVANEDEENSFVTVQLSGKNFLKHVDISYQLSKMSIPAFETYLVEEISQRIGSAIANDVYAQIVKDTHVDNKFNTAGEALAFADVLKSFGQLKGVGSGVTIYANPKTLYGQIASLPGAEGQNAFVHVPQEGIDGRLVGKAVKQEDAVPDGVVLVVDPKQYTFNEVQGFAIETDRDIKAGVITVAGRVIGEGTLTNDKAAVVLTVAAP